MDDGYQYKCSYTDIAEDFGRLQAADDTEISHVQGTADANDTFALNSGALSVTTNRAADASYYLEDGKVKIEATNGVVISAQASFATRDTVRTVSFKYNHSGLRTQKTVVENGITTTYDYTLHGKLITHLTKRVVDEDGNETTQELHFFYDSQSKPAFVKYSGAMYRYVHNLQGDIVAIVDDTGNAVVEYKYDAWGKLVGIINEIGIGTISPFRYRGYVWDATTKLYYLRNRYYDVNTMRFICGDDRLNRNIFGANVFSYCVNSPIIFSDPSGTRHVMGATLKKDQHILNRKRKQRLEQQALAQLASFGIGVDTSELSNFSSIISRKYLDQESATALNIAADSVIGGFASMISDMLTGIWKNLVTEIFSGIFGFTGGFIYSRATEKVHQNPGNYNSMVYSWTRTPTSFWSSGAYDIYYEVKEYYNQGIYEVWYWEDNYESFYVPVKIYSTPVSEELMDP